MIQENEIVKNKDLSNYTQIIDDVISKMNSSDEIMYIYGGVSNKNIQEIWLTHLDIYPWDNPTYENIIITIIVIPNLQIQMYKSELSYLSFYFINKLKEIFGLKCLNDKFTDSNDDINHINYGEIFILYFLCKKKKVLL